MTFSKAKDRDAHEAMLSPEDAKRKRKQENDRLRKRRKKMAAVLSAAGLSAFDKVNDAVCHPPTKKSSAPRRTDRPNE